MRDANALQRRRRMRLLRQDETATNGDLNGSREPVDPDEARAQLLKQCGGQPDLQLVIEVNGEAHARKVSLNRPCLLVGSDAGCDIRIQHASVLPYHAYLQWIDGRLFCCGLGDADSMAAWVGPKPVSLGSFRVSAPEMEPLGDGPTDPQVRSSELAAEVPQIQLKFVGVEQTDNLWPVDRRLTLIGRGAQCKLRLDHPKMPVVLASLIRTNGGCWLIDLSGSEGLLVNGQPSYGLQSLDVGDKVQLGEFAAEVAAIPFPVKPAKPRPAPKVSSVRELATQHRTHLGTIKESFETVQYYLDTDHLDGLPELKTALQQYVLHVQRHHRELQAALERLAGTAESATIQG